MKPGLPVIYYLLAGLVGSAGPAHGQTLEDALIAAYINNPTLLAQRASLRATDEQVPQALSEWRPTIEMSFDAGTSAVRSFTTTGPDRGQHREPRTMSLSFSQPLFNGGRTLAATRSAENTVKAGRARLVAVEQDVFLDAVTAYMDVYRDQAVVELNVNNERVLERQLEATTDRFEVGEITRTDVHQAQARLAKATADRIQAAGNLEASRAAYTNVIGEAPGRLLAPTPGLDRVDKAMEAVKAAVDGNPDMIAAEYDRRAALNDVVETRGELLPTIDLSGSAKRAFQTASETSRIDGYEAKVTLTVPLYQAGAVYSRLRKARQTVQERRRDVDKARRDVTEQATRTWEALQTVRARIASFNTQIEAAEVALEGVEREATVGSRTVLDVLDAEQELLDARVSLVRAQRDEMVAIFELKAAMGRLTAQHLNLPVDFYDPRDHYQEVRDRWFGGQSTGGAE